jgi:hypothetical protein
MLANCTWDTVLYARETVYSAKFYLGDGNNSQLGIIFHTVFPRDFYFPPIISSCVSWQCIVYSISLHKWVIKPYVTRADTGPSFLPYTMSLDKGSFTKHWGLGLIFSCPKNEVQDRRSLLSLWVKAETASLFLYDRLIDWDKKSARSHWFPGSFRRLPPGGGGGLKSARSHLLPGSLRGFSDEGCGAGGRRRVKFRRQADLAPHGPVQPDKGTVLLKSSCKIMNVIIILYMKF